MEYQDNDLRKNARLVEVVKTDASGHQYRDTLLILPSSATSFKRFAGRVIQDKTVKIEKVPDFKP